MRALVLTATALGVGALAPLTARHRFESRVAGEVDRLWSHPAAIAVGPEQFRARASVLPAPVRRYFDFATGGHAPAVRTAHLLHGGTFRTSPDASWFPIAGEQFVTAGTPGFVWHATLRPLPLVWIEARDRLEAGHGHMLVKALSLFTLADAASPEIDQSAHLRWLGEAAWVPYALVADAVRWEPIDDHSARASLEGAGPGVTAVFEFEADGRLSAFRADRYRDVGGGRAVLTPFVGRCSEYRHIGAFRVPTSVEATWRLESGDFTFARFQVSSIEYN